ncbi:anthranilate synthase component I family protein [Candidatus Micrarchaeota archaeon]|nr:anthranilate synthase component I family protein [Candidatus Micrarchaeota archaeon]MBU1166349.1 anthranilate synthase component I family protein [Candidatus Micrarchaeota archaeon]MBU1886399.1 anthranilate synthase component I family protein [Candidatus Micrarchaeota archaeon]
MITKELKLALNPYQIYSLVQREYENSFLLESLEGKEKLARFSFIGFEPKDKIIAKGTVIAIGDEETETDKPLAMMAENMPKSKLEKQGFVGGAVGYFSYDYVRQLENISTKQKGREEFPDFEFGLFDDGLIYDHRDKTIQYFSHSEDRSAEILKLAKEDTFLGPFETGRIKENVNKDEYEKMVAIAKERITDGEIFQVVLSRRYEIPFEGNPLRFYNFLKQTNPSPYMYYLSFGDRKIIGSSPENLVRIEGRKIDSYATLAGTMPRGKTPVEDMELEQKLLNSEKEKAEHLMLVDLTRNDIGKVAEFGTVKVPELMEVHKYKDVQHMCSHVTGTLMEGKTCFDAFNAMFPAGTVTGAPKVRAMEIIEELEPDKRGPYSGAVGYFSYNGNCDFAIAIRTLIAQRQKAYVQAGAGIVYDSVPENEYNETENKMRSLLRALEVRF